MGPLPGRPPLLAVRQPAGPPPPGAERSEHVMALNIGERPTSVRASRRSPRSTSTRQCVVDAGRGRGRRWVLGDVLTHPYCPTSSAPRTFITPGPFDVVASVATPHHLPDLERRVASAGRPHLAGRGASQSGVVTCRVVSRTSRADRRSGAATHLVNWVGLKDEPAIFAVGFCPTTVDGG
jgi:hypothetical protein